MTTNASPAATSHVVVELDPSPGGGGTVVGSSTTRAAADALADVLATGARARARRLSYEVAAVHEPDAAELVAKADWYEAVAAALPDDEATVGTLDEATVSTLLGGPDPAVTS